MASYHPIPSATTQAASRAETLAALAALPLWARGVAGGYAALLALGAPLPANETKLAELLGLKRYKRTTNLPLYGQALQIGAALAVLFSAGELKSADFSKPPETPSQQGAAPDAGGDVYARDGFIKPSEILFKKPAEVEKVIPNPEPADDVWLAFARARVRHGVPLNGTLTLEQNLKFKPCKARALRICAGLGCTLAAFADRMVAHAKARGLAGAMGAVVEHWFALEAATKADLTPAGQPTPWKASRPASGTHKASAPAASCSHASHRPATPPEVPRTCSPAVSQPEVATMRAMLRRTCAGAART